MEATDLIDGMDDANAYLVYADELLAAGDPRGELIMVQHALDTLGGRLEAERRQFRGRVGSEEFVEAEPGRQLDRLRAREAELLEKHEESLLGPLTHYRDLLEVTWRWGFVHRMTVSFGQTDPIRTLGAIVTSPATVLLQDLTLTAAELLADFQPLMERMADAGRPRGLRRLFLGKDPARGARLGPPAMIGRVALLNDVLAGLQRLILQGSAIDLSGVRLPELEELEIRSLHPEFMSETFTTDWPKLQRLTLSFPFAPTDQMQPLFEARGMDRLRHLRVGYPRSWGVQPGLSPQWCEALVDSPLLFRLRTLTLEGEIEDEAVEVLAAAAERLAHLDRLQVDRSGLSWQGWNRFRELIRNMVKSRADEPGDDRA